MPKVTYSSNNSGGGWWLSDDDWHALERAGWDVDWYANMNDKYGSYKNGRFLGALASSASKDFPSMGDAIDEWERLTGKNSAALGCSCCGTPHSFSSDSGDYYSPSFPVSGSRYSD